MKPIPDSAKALIEQLEEDYPPACKSLEESREEHAQYAGAVALIETLRVRLDWTRENSIIGDP